MASRTPSWKWAVGLVVMAISAAVAVPLWRYADADDAPGGMVIALLLFLLGAGVATWIVSPREESRKPGSN